MRTKKKCLIAILSLIMMLAMFVGIFPTAVFADVSEPGDEEQNQEIIYDFTVPGSTIRFLDKEGNPLTEEPGWGEGESVVHTWYVFMYRATKGDLKLGYSPEGTLFLPHKVYEGETAELFYAKDNNLFRMSANKDSEQIFDGSEILNTISLTATNGTQTLTNAPVYAETPYGFAFMGATDENGAFSINATTGEFKLWITSNAGYILNKSVTVTETLTEISFADEITNAVELDVTARSETYEKALGYVVALGKPNETESVNMLTTGYVDPTKTVRVTPGTYSVATAIWLEDHNRYYSDDTSGGLWVDIAKATTITQNTTYDFAITDFEGKFAIRDEYKKDVYGYDDLMAYKVYAEHANGYVIPGRAESMDYLPQSVIVTVDDTDYPYTFGWGDFSMLYEAKVYKKGDKSTVIQEWESTDWEFSLSFDFFGETVLEYEVEYFPEWDSMSFPELFPDDVWYSTAFKTLAYAGEDQEYKEFESMEYFHNVYYIEDGEMKSAVYDYRDDRYFYSIPKTIQNGDNLVGVFWGYDQLTYGVIPVTDELFTNGYTFAQPEYSQVDIVVKNGESDETEYTVNFAITVKAGEQQFRLGGLESGTRIPYGEYDFTISASAESRSEEWELLESAVVIHNEKRAVAQATCSFEVDYSSFKSFTIDASKYFENCTGYVDGYRKDIALYFADGSVEYVTMNSAPITVYTQTLPDYATGEAYYYGLDEMTPFSPYVSYAKFTIEDGETYKFDFKPSALEVIGTASDNGRDVVLTYKVTDGFGNVLDDMWNLLNEWGVHNPLKEKEYPFRDENGNPIHYQYSVDVYVRLKGETEYEKMSFNDFTNANLGALAAGEYEGYIEINFDTYLDEYMVEYPYEKGFYEDWWRIYLSVYDNVARVLHGVLRDEFTFEVIEAHEHIWGTWTDDDNDETHTRGCTVSNCSATQTNPHAWDDGVVTKEATTREEGIRTYTCSDCGSERTESIAVRVENVENEDKGVSLDVPTGSQAYIPLGTVFDVVEVDEEQVPEEVLGEIELQMDGSAKPLACYDLSLLLDGVEIQPDGTVEITLPALQQEFDGDKVVVVYIAPDGSYEECETIVNPDGTITFKTNHFSRYAVIGVNSNQTNPDTPNDTPNPDTPNPDTPNTDTPNTDNPAPEKKGNVGLVIGVIAGVLALGGGGAVFFLKKKKQN